MMFHTAFTVIMIIISIIIAVVICSSNSAKHDALKAL